MISKKSCSQLAMLVWSLIFFATNFTPTLFLRFVEKYLATLEMLIEKLASLRSQLLFSCPPISNSITRSRILVRAFLLIEWRIFSFGMAPQQREKITIRWGLLVWEQRAFSL